jgi:hypothetical protein
MTTNRIEKYIPFETFSKECEARGYVPVQDNKNRNYHVKLTTKTRKVQVELSERSFFYGKNKPVIVIPTFLLKSKSDYNWDQINAIESVIEENNIKIQNRFGKNGNPMLVLRTDIDRLLDDFFFVVDCLENLSELVVEYNRSKKDDSDNNQWGFAYDNTNLQAAYGYLYDVLVASMKRGYTAGLKRQFLGVLDMVDEHITIGKSKTMVDHEREHLIPCDYQIKYYLKMIQNNAPEQEVINEMIYANKIVLLPNKDRLKIDQVHKTTMPIGWQWGDAITARLDIFDIDYHLYDDTEHKKWDPNCLFSFGT